jgi:phage-related protein
MPGGALITRALDGYGIIDRVAGWVQQQMNSLGLVASSIRQAVDRFLDSLSWTDIFDLGGVWERAKRIVTEPIARITSFIGNLVSGILQFIRDAVLRPLAGLAQGTRGWDLLCAVLGRNPITGDAVPRTAETLIGGFMRLIGQEEVWQNLQQSRAVPRAMAWFQGALAGLMGFVTALPGLFLSTLRSLGINDLLTPLQTFGRIVRVFGDFAGRFVAWAGAQVMSLLEIIFDVVAPAVMPYIRRAAGAFRTIVANPIGFVRNLVRAAVQGFRQFATNILAHLRAALIGWLTGAMGAANIYIPQAFTLQEIIKFVLSVLGLTWQNIRGKLVRVVGERAVATMETGFDIVVTLVRDGPAAAWERIRESLSNLREMVMEQIITFVRDRIVVAAVTRLVSMLNPAGAFIQAIIAIYNTVMFFVERLRQIAQVTAAFIDSIAAIAGGVIAAAANRVEQTMAGLLTLVISFLARLVGLGRVSDAITNIINRIRAPIDRALDRVVAWIAGIGRRFLARDPSPTSTVRGPLLVALTRSWPARARWNRSIRSCSAWQHRIATRAFVGSVCRRPMPMVRCRCWPKPIRRHRSPCSGRRGRCRADAACGPISN